MCRKMKLDHHLILHTRINSKWVKDLNVRPQVIKILEENRVSKILDIAHSNILLDISPGKGNQRKNKQIGLHQAKHFCTPKENIDKKKTTHRIREHIHQYI